MNPRIPILLLIATAWGSCLWETQAAGASEKMSGTAKSQATPTGYQAFSAMRLRNIFDPNRKPIRTEPNAPVSPSKARAALTLTGTLVTEKTALAFFAGAGGEPGKVLGIAQAIGEFKITSIAPGQVGLEREGQPLVLSVGKSLPLEGGSETPAALENAPVVGVPETPSPAPQPPPSAPSPTSNTDANPDRSEILRRMMERRQKEMSK
jgi:type II secretory pathway component PulC